MIPLKDDNPSRTTPVVTISLIAVNTVVFLYQWLQGLPLASLKYALYPATVTGAASREAIALYQYHIRPQDIQALGIHSLHPEWLSIFTSMFMHGSWMHLIGNMWFLWIFGNNVEDALGKGRFLGFYLVCGLGAAIAQIVMGPASTVPMVGASGAIAGVLGAYLVLFPGSQVLTAITAFVIIFVREIPAWIVLGFWFLLNLVNSFVGIGGKAAGGGVAYMAHVGGFALGWVLIRVFGDQLQPPSPRYARYRNHGPDDWR